MGCSNDNPCEIPVLRWVHSTSCKAITNHWVKSHYSQVMQVNKKLEEAIKNLVQNPESEEFRKYAASLIGIHNSNT